MNLFQEGSFKSHSGLIVSRKVDCDALSDESIECLAKWISDKITFNGLHPIPRGGTCLAEALKQYEETPKSLYNNTILVVDDVCTTGASFEYARGLYRNRAEIIGVCIFAIGDYPDWVHPLFPVSPFFRYVPTYGSPSIVNNCVQPTEYSGKP